MLSFLGRVFVEENARSLPGSELASRLDDELFMLNERLGPGAYPKLAKAYLDDWAAPEVGWLRRYYPEGLNEPYFDATVAVEKALSWVASIRERSFVGTESRLNIVHRLHQHPTQHRIPVLMPGLIDAGAPPGHRTVSGVRAGVETFSHPPWFGWPA